jgi:hypothetical protein
MRNTTILLAEAPGLREDTSQSKSLNRSAASHQRDLRDVTHRHAFSHLPWTITFILSTAALTCAVVVGLINGFATARVAVHVAQERSERLDVSRRQLEELGQLQASVREVRSEAVLAVPPLFAQAQQRFAAGDFFEAEASYGRFLTESSSATWRPSALLNSAVTNARLGNCALARARLARLRMEHPQLLKEPATRLVNAMCGAGQGSSRTLRFGKDAEM